MEEPGPALDGPSKEATSGPEQALRKSVKGISCSLCLLPCLRMTHVFFIVKISYTFGSDDSRSYLTRLGSDELITVINSDPTAPVGIMELKPCLMEIVSAS